MHGVSHTVYLARETAERGRNKHKNNSERVVNNLEDRNVGTKRKRLKQALTSA